MNDRTKKMLDESLKEEESKKNERQRIQDLRSNNRAISDLIRSCYVNEIEKHLRILVDEIGSIYKEKKIIGHIVMPGINPSINSFHQWISLLNKERINIDIRSLLSNDGTYFNDLEIEINNEKKVVIGYGLIKDPNSLGYNFIFTYYNNECDICLLENINHSKPPLDTNSRPFEYDELDLRIRRIQIKSSDVITNIIIDKSEILQKLENLVSINLVKY